MNIDLLMTRKNESGLVHDTPIGFPPTHVILDYEAGHMTLYGNGEKSLWMNIPVASDTLEKIIQTMGLHVGYLKDGLIEDIIYVPLVISTVMDINVERVIPPPRVSAISFEIFMRECLIGQALHRDDISNDIKSSGILEDLSPSVLKFAPSLAHQRKMEMAYRHSPSPNFAPTIGFGMGGSSASSQLPLPTTYTPQNKTEQTSKRIILNPTNPEGPTNPMSFFTKSALQEKADRERDEKITEAKGILEKDLNKILKPIDKLIGMTPLKEKISSIAHLTQAKALRTLNDLPNTTFSLHMIFTGPPGTGKTTAARLIGQIMKDLGYLKTGHVVETRPSEVKAKGFQDLFEEAQGGVLFIDEAYGLADVDDYDANSQYTITSLLQLMEQHRDELIVIVAGYSNEMRRFVSSNPGLASRFSITIDFPNYSADELIQIFEKLCIDNSYTLLPEARDALKNHLSTFVISDDLKAFGNGRGIRNLFEKTLIQQAQRLMVKKTTDHALIKEIMAVDIINKTQQATSITNEELEELLAPLNKMVGLDNIKKDIYDLVHLLRAHTIRQQAGLPIPPLVLHSLFLGPSGTGKTTIARLLGQILKRLGYLEKGHVVEVDKQKLTGKWLGWSEKITAEAFYEAMGGILFIDEAYSLTESSSSSNYGNDVLTTILKLMEDYRNKIVVICAGYEIEMKRFLESNSGLESRFPRHVTFKSYTVDELAILFKNLCDENKYTVSEPAIDKLISQLKSLSVENINKLGNARLVRNIFEKTIIAQSRRITMSSIEISQISSIQEEDITFPDQSHEEKHFGFV